MNKVSGTKQSQWHQASRAPEANRISPWMVWPAGTENVTSQLISSRHFSRTKELIAYLQLYATGPFYGYRSTLGPYAKQTQTFGFNPQPMMDTVLVDKSLSVGIIFISQGETAGRSPLA